MLEFSLDRTAAFIAHVKRSEVTLISMDREGKREKHDEKVRESLTLGKFCSTP